MEKWVILGLMDSDSHSHQEVPLYHQYKNFYLLVSFQIMCKLPKNLVETLELALLTEFKPITQKFLEVFETT